MRASASLAWRIASAVAFGATAALAVTLSRGPHAHVALTSEKAAATTHASASVPPAAHCTARALRIALGPGSRVSGDVTRYPLDFTNVSGAACTLAGYPQVTAYRGNGAPVGAAAGEDRAAAARPVLLGAGQTGHATLEATVSAVRCHPVRVTGLRVTVPGQSTVSYVRGPWRACTARAPRGQHYLLVGAVAPGAGHAGGTVPSAASARSTAAAS